MKNYPGIETAVDLQMVELWEQIHIYYDAKGFIEFEFLAMAVRAAWAKGAVDALREPKEVREMIEGHGYRISET